MMNNDTTDNSIIGEASNKILLLPEAEEPLPPVFLEDGGIVAGQAESELLPENEDIPDEQRPASSEPPVMESAPIDEAEPVTEGTPGSQIEHGAEQPGTEEEPPVAQVDLTPILEMLGQLQDQMIKLREDFNAKLRYDASKKEIIDKQFHELDAYHREAHEKLAKAIVMDIISEIDGAERSAEHFEALTPTQENFARLKKLIVAQAEDLRDLLENNDITSYRTEPGEAFNHKRHSVLKTITTDKQEQAKTIQASLRWGFEKDGKVLRPEKVAVYVLNSQQ